MTKRDDLAHIRKDYTRHSMAPEDCLPSPLAQFSRWLDEAIAAQVNEPTAMNVATVVDGRPSARMVSLSVGSRVPTTTPRTAITTTTTMPMVHHMVRRPACCG